MEYTCGVCGEKVEGDPSEYVNHTEKHIVDAIQSDHPEWGGEDGVCQKCLEYYHKQLKGDSSPEEC